jgi:diguanylate cyclase (GGDEF)-like protein/PAS domain S-box-containing protein
LRFIKLSSIERNILLIAFVWSSVFALSIWSEIEHEEETVIQLAINIIQSNYNEIDAFRHWIAAQGGIYVPISDAVKPNPSLSHIPERDIPTPSGEVLTLINTPYILRQLVQEQNSSFNAHMVSLTPLNPLNQPDEWERKALNMLYKGNNEYCEIVDYKNKPYMRLIKPTRFNSDCGSCHTENNYNEDDVIGGITLSVPMQPYYDKSAVIIKNIYINHGLIWLLGIVSLGVLYRHEKKHDLKRKETEDSLRQSSVAFSNLAEGVVITDPMLGIIAVNEAFTKITGYSQVEMMESSQTFLKPDYFENNQYDEFKIAIKNDAHWEGDILYPDKSKNLIPINLSASTVKDEKNILANYIFVCSDITERKSFEKTLQHLAQHDHLTNLPNRALLNDRLELAMIRVEREKKKLAVLFLDLDHFKKINDSMGHDVGDKILIQISNRLKNTIRKGDTLARYGGDEFIVIMEGIEMHSDAERIAKKIIDCVNPEFIIDNKHYNLGVSIGISIYPEHADTISVLISNADKAMYSAKTVGRNTYKLYSTDQTLNDENKT